jgi:hypothetical protein
LEIKKLTAEEISAVYGVYMREDFPANELKPLELFLSTVSAGIAGGYGYFDGGALRAYAFFAWAEDSRLALLDYLAVTRGERGRGVGGEFLTKLAGDIPFDGMLIEIEDPLRAENAAEREKREKRARFYMRNGAVRTGLRTRMLDVRYEVLRLGRGGEYGLAACESELRGIYRRMVAPELYSKYLSIPDE